MTTPVQQGRFDGPQNLGSFIDGKQDGSFTVKGKGWAFKGEYKNGLRDGPGVLVMSNGVTYDGTWKNGLKHGEFEVKTKQTTSSGVQTVEEKRIYDNGIWKFDLTNESPGYIKQFKHK